MCIFGHGNTMFQRLILPGTLDVPPSSPLCSLLIPHNAVGNGRYHYGMSQSRDA